MLNTNGKRFFILLLILFTSSNFLAAANIRYTKAYGRNYVYLPDVAKYYGMSYSEAKKKQCYSVNILF